MGFELFDRDAARAQRVRAWPPMVAIAPGAKILLNPAAAQMLDMLALFNWEPDGSRHAPGPPDREMRPTRSVQSVELLYDAENRRIALRPCPDDQAGPTVFRVQKTTFAGSDMFALKWPYLISCGSFLHHHAIDQKIDVQYPASDHGEDHPGLFVIDLGGAVGQSGGEYTGEGGTAHEGDQVQQLRGGHRSRGEPDPVR